MDRTGSCTRSAADLSPRLPPLSRTRRGPFLRAADAEDAESRLEKAPTRAQRARRVFLQTPSLRRDSSKCSETLPQQTTAGYHKDRRPLSRGTRGQSAPNDARAMRLQEFAAKALAVVGNSQSTRSGRARARARGRARSPWETTTDLGRVGVSPFSPCGAPAALPPSPPRDAARSHPRCFPSLPRLGGRAAAATNTNASVFSILHASFDERRHGPFRPRLLPRLSRAGSGAKAPRSARDRAAPPAGRESQGSRPFAAALRGTRLSAPLHSRSREGHLGVALLIAP